MKAVVWEKGCCERQIEEGKHGLVYLVNRQEWCIGGCKSLVEDMYFM